MIFVTTGTQEPFDRFLEIIDSLAPEIDEELVVQACSSAYTPHNYKLRGFIAPDEFNGIMERARLIVAHAGMGSILTAMQMRKPIIIFPRKASLGEHRNDHQMAMAHRMAELRYVHVAYDADDLRRLLSDNGLQPLHSVGEFASESLVSSIADFIAK